MSGSKTISTSSTKLDALQLQSSSYGVTIPVAYGVTRVPGNLFWYNGFRAIPHTTSEAVGKGGGTVMENTTYTYEAATMMGLCDHELSGVARIWRGKKVYSGGPTPVQINTVSQAYTVPAGGGSVTVTNAAAFSSAINVTALTGAGEESNVAFQLAEGTDYTRVGGTYTFLPSSVVSAGGTTVVTINYQYLSGGVVQTSLQSLGLSFAKGLIGQATWSYLTSSYPAQAVPYSGVSYVYSSAYSLGGEASIENHNFEVQAQFAYHLGSSVPDVDTALVGYDILTNVKYGVSFPALRLGSTGAWSNYCRAAGLLMSPAFTEQDEAAALLKKLAEYTNTGLVWSEGLLKFIPYGDITLTGNGATYTPNVTPVYDLNDDVFLDKDNPIKVIRKPPADAFNHVRVEFRNRANSYNLDIAEAKDQANIDAFGLRSHDVISIHWVCDAAVAQRVAQLLMQRMLYIRNTYEFKLPWNYVLLEPMDLVTLTDSHLQFSLLPVRIIEVNEAEDGELSMIAEDFPLGVANASAYGSQSGSGFEHNYNVSPGSASAPVIFEGPAQVTATGLEVFVAARGVNVNWGGCNVWLSLDGTEYRQLGRINGGSRYGTITGPIAAGVLPVSILGGQLHSGTAADANALTTLCYVGGAVKEFLAYTTATLTGTLAYNLGGLQRGAYGSSAASAHVAADPFVRIDENVARSGLLDLSYIGKTLYVKLTSFNVFGGGEQSLADVAATTYIISGFGAQLQPGIAGKAVNLRASSLTFQYPKAGGVNPSSITLTAERKGLLEGAVTWSVVTGTATLGGSGDVRTLAAGDLATDTATIRATITDGVGTYIAEVTVNKVREGFDGSNGTNGANVAQVYIYQRAASAPALPSVTTTFTFATGALTGLNNGWQQGVPSGTNPLYVSLAIASSAGASDTVAPAEWAAPVVMAQDGATGAAGAAGAAGASGLNNATVYLFKRTTTNAAPAVPTTTSTFTFSTGVLTGHDNGWTQNLPTAGGGFRWMITAAALSTGSTDTIATTEWNVPAILAENGVNGTGIFTWVDSGTTSAPGTVTGAGSGTWGASGAYSLERYSGGAFMSARPANTTYSMFIGLNADPALDANYTSIDFAWYCEAGGNLFMYSSGSSLGAAGTYDSDTILTIVYDNAFVRFYKNGVSENSVAVQPWRLFYLDTAFLTQGTWNNVAFGPVGKAGFDGAAGVSSAQVYIYQRAASAPALPSASTTFTFNTGVLTGLNNGWTQGVPGGTNPLYVSSAVASGSSATDTIAPAEWAAAVVMAQNGATGSTGAAGLNSATVYLFKRTATNAAPAVPTTTSTYTFSSGVLTGHDNGWTQSLPATGDQYRWMITSAALSTGSTDAIAPTEWNAPAVLSSGGVKTSIQTSAPTAESVGELWFDSDDGNKKYRWDGTAWIAVALGTGGLELGAATESGTVFVASDAYSYPLAVGVQDRTFTELTYTNNTGAAVIVEVTATADRQYTTSSGQSGTAEFKCWVSTRNITDSLIAGPGALPSQITAQAAGVTARFTESTTFEVSVPAGKQYGFTPYARSTTTTGSTGVPSVTTTNYSLRFAAIKR